MISFTIPGPPVPKERPRVGANRAVYTPAKTAAYEEKVAWMAKTAMRARRPLEGPVSLSVTVYTRNKRRGDLDNYLKAVADGCNRIVWVDDRQVVSMVGRFGESPDPRVEVEVQALAAGGVDQ